MIVGSELRFGLGRVSDAEQNAHNSQISMYHSRFRHNNMNHTTQLCGHVVGLVMNKNVAGSCLCRGLNH